MKAVKAKNLAVEVMESPANFTFQGFLCTSIEADGKVTSMPKALKEYFIQILLHGHWRTADSTKPACNPML